MKKFSFFFIVGFIILNLNTSEALTPQQYCEKLHSKRPTGTTTSYELLNIDFINDSVISYIVPYACKCNNGKWDTSKSGTSCFAGECSSDGGFTGEYKNNFSFNYKIEISAKKECKNGNFVYKKETKKEYISGNLPAGETAISNVCVGTGC